MSRRTRSSMIDATRAKLLAAARHAFGSHGYANTSMDDLTAQVGLTRGALYHHFGGKEGLLGALVESMDKEVEERLEASTLLITDPWERLRRQCRGYLELALEPEFRRIVLQESRAVLGNFSPESQSRSLSLLKRTLEALIQQGMIQNLNVEALAKLIYGMLSESIFWIAEENSDPTERLESSYRCLTAMLDGLLIRNNERPV